jgi:hypothetical protein
MGFGILDPFQKLCPEFDQEPDKRAYSFLKTQNASPTSPGEAFRVRAKLVT